MDNRDGPCSGEDGLPKIIYILGAGRSGSTVFGVMLGSCAGVFNAGELEAWLRRSGIPNFGGSERAGFWSSVLDRVGGEDIFGEEAWLSLEHSSVLLRPDRWRARKRVRDRYLEVARRLYLAVSELSGASCIVDTSHYPLRLKELKTLEGVDLYVVYLVRNAHDVIASFNRTDVAQKSKAPLLTNAYLWLTNLVSTVVFLSQRRDRRIFVRYEDFVDDPGAVLSQVLKMLGSSSMLPGTTAVATGMPFQGNRILKSDTIDFRTGEHRRAQRSLLTQMIQAPWEPVLGRLRPAATIDEPLVD